MLYFRSYVGTTMVTATPSLFGTHSSMALSLVDGIVITVLLVEHPHFVGAIAAAVVVVARDPFKRSRLRRSEAI